MIIKMKAKPLENVLRVFVVFCCSALFQISANAQNGYEVLFEENFDTGTATDYKMVSEEHEEYLYTANFSNPGCVVVDFDGNQGISTNANAVPKEKNIFFDFTKNGAQSAVSSGIYEISFDFSGRSTAVTDVAYVGMNTKRSSIWAWECGRLLAYKNTYINPVGSVGGWHGAGVKVEIDPNKKYHLELVFNFDIGNVTYYLDGSQIARYSLSGSYAEMKDITIAMSAFWDYFDNLKLEKYDSIPMEVSIGDITSGGVELLFTDGVLDNAICNDDTVFINSIYTNETISAKASYIGSKKVLVKPEKPLIEGYEYELILPEKIIGAQGGECNTEPKYWFNFADSNAIKTLRLKDFKGETHILQKNNSPQIAGIVFEFTDDADVETALSTLNIEDKGGNKVYYETIYAGNIGEVLFTNLLVGGRTYIITLEGLFTDYQIVVNTEDGGAAIKEFKIYNEDKTEEIISLSQISTGDVINVKAEIANTSEDSVDCLTLIGMYNGKLMTGINYKSLKLDAGKFDTAEFKFTVLNSDELKFTAKLWDLANKYPIIPEIIF